MRAQLDHARAIRFSKKELIWLAGNTFYGKTQMFSPDFINWLGSVPASRIRAAQGRRPVRTAFPRALDPHHDVGDSGARHSQRVALAPGDERTGPICPRCALCPRQGQAVDQGRAPAQTGRTCVFPISGRGGATAFCGSAGASRPSRKASGRPSPAPRMCCWRWTTIWKRSAPMRMNCRWSPRRWPTTIPNCAGRRTAFSINGAIPMAAIF